MTKGNVFLYFRRNEIKKRHEKKQVINRYQVYQGRGFSLFKDSFLLALVIHVITTLLLPGSSAFSKKTYRSLDRLLSLVNNFYKNKNYSNNNKINNNNKSKTCYLKMLQIIQLVKMCVGIHFAVHKFRILPQFCHLPPSKFCVIRQAC